MIHFSRINPLFTDDKQIIVFYLFGTFLALLVLNLSSLAIIFPFALLFLLLITSSPDLAYFSIIASIPVALEIGGGLTVTTLVMPLAVLFLLLNASVHRCRWPITITGGEAFFAMCFFFSVVISAFLSTNVGYALKDGIVTAVFFIIFFTSLTYIKGESSLKQLLWVLIITGIVEALITVAQVKIGFTLPGEWRLTNLEAIDTDTEFRADGTTTHPIILANFLQLTIVATVAEIIWNRTLWIKILLAAGLGLMIMAWYYAFSRTSFVAVGVTMGIALLLRGKAWAYAISVMSILGILLVLTLKFESIDDLLQGIEALNFFSSSTSSLDLNTSIDSFGFRIEQFIASWGLFLDQPVIGVGFDQAIRYYEPYLPHWAINYFHPQVIHNIFFQVLCELGVLGLIAFIGVWVAAFYSIKSAWSHAVFGRYAKLIFLFLVGQLIMGGMNPMMREIWLALAMAGAIGKLAKTDKRMNHNEAIVKQNDSSLFKQTKPL